VLFKKNNKALNLKELIEGCRKGSSSSQRLLFDTYSSKAMRICSKYASNDMETEEIVMDGFLKVFKNIEKYNDQYEFGGWFHKVMVNSAIDYFRKNHSKIEFTDLEKYENVDFNPNRLDLLSVEEILEFVRKLSPVYRTVFSLSVIEGYENSEIAILLGLTESGVRGNLSKAKSRLQGWINEYINRQELK
jgi:RNA polymerase sigma-70 factor (ECF subfamily)